MITEKNNSYLSDEFLDKRIQEQRDYIESVNKMNITEGRRIELLGSAQGQLTYFEIYRFGKPLAIEIDKIEISPSVFAGYKDEMNNIMSPQKEFESIAAKALSPFSLDKAIHG